MGVYSSFGKRKRMDRLFSNGKTLIVPVDDSLIFGPYNGLFDLASTLYMITSSSPSAILGYKGSYSVFMNQSNDIQIPLILNITASTAMGNHVSKIASCSSLEALKMGADCVAVHINYTSSYENEMLKNLAVVATEADSLGMPVLAIAYPRKRDSLDNDDNYTELKVNDIERYTDLVCHCVRTSVELGADIIKTQYTGSVETFKRVVASALGKPVVIAGGPVLKVEDSYSMAYDALQAGAAGISFGRNVFNSNNIQSYIYGLKELVFQSGTVETALKKYRGECKDV